MGVDFKVRGKRPHKADLAMFCYFATEMIHLALVTNLTAESFISALKLLIGRRHKPFDRRHPASATGARLEGVMNSS